MTPMPGHGQLLLYVVSKKKWDGSLVVLWCPLMLDNAVEKGLVKYW